MKRVRPLVVASLLSAALLFGAGATARAQGTFHVVTIYFAGTSAAIDWWRGDAQADFYPCDIVGFPGWFPLSDWFGKPELLATLHHNQVATTPQADGNGFSPDDSRVTVPGSGIVLIHHKYFVNGVGTGPWGTRVWDRQNPARAGASMGWDNIRWLAQEHLKYILDRTEPHGIILNVVGWSRGGISALDFANRVAREHEKGYNPSNGIDANDDLYKGRIKKINILAFEPVSGITSEYASVPWPEYFLFDNLSAINEVVVIYGHDERSADFYPTIPRAALSGPGQLGGLGQQRLLFSVPGSHETLVGNAWNDGHSLHSINRWDSNWGAFQTFGTISGVSDLTAVIATQLLRSPEWGAAKFANASWVRPESLSGYCWDYSGVFADIVNPYKTFDGLFNSRYNLSVLYTYYWRMHYLGFVPEGWPAWGVLDSNDDRRTVWEPAYPPYYDDYFQEALPYWFKFDSGYRLDLYAGYFGGWVRDAVWGMRGRSPVADAGPDQIVQPSAGSTQCAVTLNGSGSYDPDHGSPQGDQPWTYYDWRNITTGTSLPSGYRLKHQGLCGCPRAVTRYA